MKPEMTADAAIDLLQLLEKGGIEVWLDGGWAAVMVYESAMRLQFDREELDPLIKQIKRINLTPQDPRLQLMRIRAPLSRKPLGSISQ